MAGIKGINIKIGADTMGLDKALQGVEANSRKTASELNTINRTLRTVGDSAVIWKQKQELLTAALDDSRKKVKLLEDAQEEVAKQLAGGKISPEQYRAFERELETARAKSKQLGEQLADTSKKVSDMGKSANSFALDKVLQEVQSKGKGTKKELDEINRALKSAGDSSLLWNQKQKLLTKAIQEAKEKVDLLGKARNEAAKRLANGELSPEEYRAFERELEKARGEVKQLENELGKLGNSADGAEKEVSELGDEAEKSGKSLDELGDEADESGEKFNKAKEKIGEFVQNGIRLAGQAIKDFAKDAVETGKQFESSVSGVKAISGATADEISLISDKSKELGAATKYTAAQSADAFSYMALASWNVNEMLAGIGGVLDLAAGSNMDLARASDIVTDYLTAFGLTAQDSAHFVDMMSYAMSNSNTSTELLGEAYKNCAATAASMGYSAEEVTAVLMTMANAGVKGGEAGTGLSTIMTRLATDTKSCAAILGDYGVKIYDTKGNMNSLSSILEGIASVWKDLTDEEQANLAKTIAGTNQYSKLQTIMNGLSDATKASGKSFADYAEALRNCDGTAQDMASTMIDNLAGDMTILDSAIDGVKIRISEQLNPVIRTVVQYITEQVPELSERIAEVTEKGVDIVEFVLENLPEIEKKLNAVMPLVKGIGAAFLAWKIVDISKKTASGITALSSTIKLLNAAMAANPAVAVTTFRQPVFQCLRCQSERYCKPQPPP